MVSKVACKYFKTHGPPPRGMDGSDPQAVDEIVELEAAIYEMFNKDFLTDPGAPLQHYSDSAEIVFYDLLTPGEYTGADVRRYFEFIGPQFVGLMEASDIRVWVKGDTGFVVLKQHYKGKDQDGNEFQWVMRQTDGVIKENGTWKIAHTHYSWPVVLPDFKADLMCTPGPPPWETGGH
jgi:ketosteroid isomerase-like protein